ncbi:MAG: Nuclear envelope morphology protein 1 [Icmadophila ericetorum]|nr:Nuclear envelope morphology protein 1 [Icmadophila ericetorum]
MNSLNILSARVIGQSPSPSPDKSSSSKSESETSRTRESIGINTRRIASEHEKSSTAAETEENAAQSIPEIKLEESGDTEITDEKTPLLGDFDARQQAETKQGRIRIAAQRLVAALAESLKWVLSKLAAPGIYLVTCFYTEQGHFSPLLPIRKMRRKYPAQTKGSTAHAIGLSGSADLSDTESEKDVTRSKPSAASIRKIKAEGDAVSVSTTDSDAGENGTIKVAKGKASSSNEDNTPQRRSIRIKLKNEDSVRAKKKKTQTNSGNNQDPNTLTAATLKSPTSPAASLRLTKYPRAPAPPRPLIPRRQPSYTAPPNSRTPHLAQKTLVIDLDETLIHSLAKGGRMSSGHMVEVKLQSAVTYSASNPSTTTTIGPQHPILYYVHKRPHCDDFLRKVCKWYNLVVFTASVQEYADPVIDWLEQERKYFSKRFYRQDCTFRNGAYIKDLSSVEPDLSRVMILDNSPLSYIFHEDNAIPIEGWINDPTDNDLLHLIPLLEGLQYVTDVRALLALRRGEVDAAGH